jgi:hypothetical protein
MAFNGAFTVNPPTTDATTFSLTDVSTGSDTNITDRRVFLFKNDGTTLVPQGSGTTYIDWPLSAGSTLTLTGILLQDWSLNIQVQWISSSPLAPPSTYSQTTLYTFTANIYNFLYGLSELQSANTLVLNDNNWKQNKFNCYMWLKDAVTTTTYGNQFLAQQAINQIYNYINNQQIYFGS